MEIRAFISEHPKFGRMRSLLIDGEPFFAGKDAATALGYKDTDQALRMHVPDKSKRVLTAKDFKQMASNQEPVILTGSQMASNQASRETGTFFSDNAMGEVQRLTFISEAGLYKLILRSKLPAAEEFSDWVCEEVLTSIRKHGYYSLVSETKPVAEKPQKESKARRRAEFACTRLRVPFGCKLVLRRQNRHEQRLGNPQKSRGARNQCHSLPHLQNVFVAPQNRSFARKALQRIFFLVQIERGIFFCRLRRSLQGSQHTGKISRSFAVR